VSAHAQQWQQANLLTGRQMVMVATIALHALVISLLMVPYTPPAVVAPDLPRWILPDNTPPPELQPPQQVEVPLKVDLVPVPITEIPVVVPIIEVPDSNAIPVEAVGSDEPAEVAVATPVDGAGTGTAAVPAIAPTALQYRIVRPTDDYYPAASLRMQESGAAIVNVCVAPSGRLEGAPTIQRSSGSQRLDAAALKWAREALRFTPATEGGVPVRACKGFRVNFQLN
jgi:protein TonB